MGVGGGSGSTEDCGFEGGGDGDCGGDDEYCINNSEVITKCNYIGHVGLSLLNVV